MEVADDTSLLLHESSDNVVFRRTGIVDGPGVRIGYLRDAPQGLVRGMKLNIEVGNLSYDTSESDLQQAFGQYGTVSSARVATARDTGRARGFGFVEMPNAAEAQAAIAGMNGTNLQGRTLTVNE